MKFLVEQIAVVDPKVIVTLDGFALKAYLRLRGRRASDGLLPNFVGKRENWNGRTIVFLPHTSGNSFWLNSTTNKDLLAAAKVQLSLALNDAGVCPRTT